MSQTSSKIQVFVYPGELRYIRPLETIANYIREKSGGGKPSRHHIARIFEPIEEFLREGKKAIALGKVMDVFARHYGFVNEEEKENVTKSVIDLLDWLAMEKSRDPVRAFKTARNLRILLIGMVISNLSVAFTVREAVKVFSDLISLLEEKKAEEVKQS